MKRRYKELKVINNRSLHGQRLQVFFYHYETHPPQELRSPIYFSHAHQWWAAQCWPKRRGRLPTRWGPRSNSCGAAPGASRTSSHGVWAQGGVLGGRGVDVRDGTPDGRREMWTLAPWDGNVDTRPFLYLSIFSLLSISLFPHQSQNYTSSSSFVRQWRLRSRCTRDGASSPRCGWRVGLGIG